MQIVIGEKSYSLKSVQETISPVASLLTVYFKNNIDIHEIYEKKDTIENQFTIVDGEIETNYVGYRFMYVQKIGHNGLMHVEKELEQTNG